MTLGYRHFAGTMETRRNKRSGVCPWNPPCPQICSIVHVLVGGLISGQRLDLFSPTWRARLLEDGTHLEVSFKHASSKLGGRSVTSFMHLKKGAQSIKDRWRAW